MTQPVTVLLLPTRTASEPFVYNWLMQGTTESDLGTSIALCIQKVHFPK